MKIRLFNNQTGETAGVLDLECAPQPGNFVSVSVNNYQVTVVRFKGTSSVDLGVTQIAKLPAVFLGK